MAVSGYSRLEGGTCPVRAVAQKKRAGARNRRKLPSLLFREAYCSDIFIGAITKLRFFQIRDCKSNAKNSPGLKKGRVLRKG
jgi:hypothetical protein